jgi:hypothetical protein
MRVVFSKSGLVGSSPKEPGTLPKILIVSFLRTGQNISFFLATQDRFFQSLMCGIVICTLGLGLCVFVLQLSPENIIWASLFAFAVGYFGGECVLLNQSY